MNAHGPTAPGRRGASAARQVAIGMAMCCGLLSRAAGQATQRQNFSVNLGSGALVGVLPFDEPFLLSGAAGERFVAIDLWYAEGRLFPPTRCSVRFIGDTIVAFGEALTRYEADTRARKPIGPALQDSATYARDSLRGFLHARWRQQVRIPADTFRLIAGPIRANTDYTFCYRIVRRPSVEDSTRFHAAAVVGLTKFLHRLLVEATGPLETEANLRAVQRALLAALPAADSMVTAGGSVLDAKDGPNLLARRLRPLFDIDQRHDRRVRNIATAAKPVTDALNSLGGASAPLDLLASTLAANRGKAGWERWGGLENTIGALVAWNGSPALAAGWKACIAAGYARIDERKTCNPVYEKMWVVDSATAHLQVVDSTRTLLMGLADYARFLQKHPESMSPKAGAAALPATLRSLDALAGYADASQSALLAQHYNLLALRDVLVEIPVTVEALASSVTSLDLAIVEMIGTTTAEYVARSKAYISADVGLLYGTGISQVAPYAGANFYSIPVNKSAPVSSCPWGFWECARKRASLTLGLTLNDIANAGETANLFANQMALVGLGLRFTDYLRATGGGIAFKTFAQDAARTPRITMKPAFSLSIDVDVKSTLGKVGELIAK